MSEQKKDLETRPDPCKKYDMHKRISYSNSQGMNDKNWCLPERQALDQCRTEKGMLLFNSKAPPKDDATSPQDTASSGSVCPVTPTPPPSQ